MEVAAVGWFVSPIISKLINNCSEYLADQPRWQTGMKKELERLQENQPKIQAVVSAASQAQKIEPDSALNKWIWQLRDVIDEADDVLDDFEYMKHEELLAKNMEKTNVSLFKSSINKIVESAFENDPMLKRLEEVVHKLDKIAVDVNIFLDLLKVTKQEQQVQQDKLQNDRETGSMPTDVLIGRGQDKEFVIQWLGKPQNEQHQSHYSSLYNNISVLSIVGPGGIGKTTLLQHVYEDNCTNYFDLKMWVCISNNFDSKKVLIDMLESPQNTTLDALQKSLKSKVMFKKFLLVLDDIWEEDEERDKSKWQKVLAPLTYGGLGSKILLTTRMSSTALMIAKVIKKKNEVLKLEGLEEDECLQLLNAHAFVDVENQNEHNKLRSIAGELVKKLYGSPLAAKVLGGALSSNLDERHWRNVLNNVLGHNVISSILELSYIFLPKHLQNCFAFCSIFAQDYDFDKDDLVRMWIAVGFIQPCCIREETLEDIGKSYFDILVKKSFFGKHGESKYKMHDLLHELAKKISSQECFRVVDEEDSERIPETIRHLSIETRNLVLLKKISKFKNLRTLCITYDSLNQAFVNVLPEIFEETRSIRLLSICAHYQNMIPEKIGCLKHLRYLGFDFSFHTLLPRSVSNIYHLQFLICKHESSDDDLFPRDMNNLFNMRYLRSPHLKFPGIGKLKFLQELNGFKVTNESGYRIEELEHMNDLRILRIQGLENVTDVQEACNAKLCDKRKLTDLSLEWGYIHDFEDQLICARLLDNLQPHKNLKKLTMKRYRGDRPAIWMTNVNLIKNLERIELEGCLKWQNLPPFGQLPFLMSLCLRDMPIAELPDLPPSLRDLSLHNLDNLNSLPSCLPSLSSLSSLYIWTAPQLRELPDLPPSLRELNLINLDNLNCLPSCLRSLSSLTSLCIWTAPQLRELPDLPPSLRELNLEGLDNLNCLPSCLPSLSSLMQLEINGAPQLRELPGLPPSLLKLKLESLDNLNCLPSCLPSLSSLTNLEISFVPQLRELPDLPPSLCRLFLFFLDNLNCLPSNLPSLSSLTQLEINDVPRLRELPDLPPSLGNLKIRGCDPEFSDTD